MRPSSRGTRRERREKHRLVAEPNERTAKSRPPWPTITLGWSLAHARGILENDALFDFMVSRSGRHRNRGVLICSQFWLGSSTSRDSNSFLRSCCADSSSSQISADTCVSLLQGKLQVSASLCKTSANLRRANIEILAREIPYFWPSPGGPAGVQDAQGAHGYAQSPYFTKIIPTTIR